MAAKQALGQQYNVEMAGQQSQPLVGILGAGVDVHGMSMAPDPTAYYAQLMTMGNGCIPTMPSPAATMSESSSPALAIVAPGSSGGMSQEQEQLLREHVFLQRQLLLLQQQQNQQQLLPMQYLQQQPVLSPVYLDHFNAQLAPTATATTAAETSNLLSTDRAGQDRTGQPLQLDGHLPQRTAPAVVWPHHHQTQHTLQQTAANSTVQDRSKNAPGAVVTRLATRVGSTREGGGLANAEPLRLEDLSMVHPSSENVSCAPASTSIPTSDSTATIIGPQPPLSSASPSRPPSLQYAQPQLQPHLHPHPQLQLQLHPPAHSPIYAHSTSSCSDLPLRHPKPHHPQQQQALCALASSSALPDISVTSALSPRKAAAKASAASSSPSKKLGRLENIYATIRKATNMRRSRVTLQEAHTQPITVAPMATLRDADGSGLNAIARKHNPDHLDLSGLSAVAPLSMPTPPLTGTGSVSSVSSSLSSLSSSFVDSGPSPLQNMYLQQQYRPLEASSEDFAFVSGLVDDPFVDNNAYLAAQQQQQQQQQQLHHQMMALGQYGKPLPDVSAPTATTAGMPLSPNAYLADATAAMSGTSVIAAAHAAHLTAAVRRDAAIVRAQAAPSSEMDMDEDWWHQSVVESAVDESTSLPPVDGRDAVDPNGNASLNMTIHMQQQQQQQQQQQHYDYQQQNGSYGDVGMATGGLMIMQPSHQQSHQQNQNQHQYYFPGVGEGTAAMAMHQSLHGGYDVAVVPPPPPMPSDRESRYDRHRRPKPRAPSAGARHYGNGSLSPRKRGSSHEDNGRISSGSGSGNIPSTPRTERRTHSMNALSRASPTPAVAAATPSSTAVRKRRSVSSMRRTSSGSSAGAEPRTPSGARRLRTPSVEAQRPTSPCGGGISFVNYTAEDHDELMTSVAPSGSSKTKARREREQFERERLLVQEAEERQAAELARLVKCENVRA